MKRCCKQQHILQLAQKEGASAAADDFFAAQIQWNDGNAKYCPGLHYGTKRRQSVQISSTASIEAWKSIGRH